MHAGKFADSYDYAKRTLIHAIADPGEWIVHPMLLRSKGGGPKGGGLCIRKYANFLGLPFCAVLPGNTRTRTKIVDDVACYHDLYLFFDPDTGIAEKGDTEHVTILQLTQITRARTGKIVLVFDHAFPDGGDPRYKVKKKLESICKREKCKPNLFSGAVIVREHRCVCFIWLSTEKKEVERVNQKLQYNLSIPKERLVTFP
ncbi:MAG: hypothetical protein OXF79_29910 [Chloroflexi bacterium]|nr:hypothetical protein [Chloroflexota bacterium]